MTRKIDPSRLTEVELLAEYVENVRHWETLDHIGAQNRLMTRRFRIVDELKQRSHGTLQPLRPLLDHEDIDVRHSAATHFRTIDHAAFEATMSDLARRGGKIGEDARASLRMDAHFQKVGYPEDAQRGPLPSLPPGVRWQSENPPPAPMSQDGIARRLTNALPLASSSLMRLARPAIGLWPQRPHANVPATASCLGGMPCAPPGWTWPMAGTEPMLFLGHINCTELRGMPSADDLPPSGLLAFFGDHDSVSGCMLTGLGTAVFHWPEIDCLRPAAPDIEPLQTLPHCALALRRLTDLPDPSSRVVQDILTDAEQVALYTAARDAVRYHGIPQELRHQCGFGKVLGWPSLVQQDDLDALRDADAGLRLLLQLDPYSNGEQTEDWGPGGSLYFLIRDRDLRARRFCACEFEMQCT
jgi:Domain of unknown function (DUF1963)